jgi:hypothetical protein
VLRKNTVTCIEDERGSVGEVVAKGVRWGNKIGIPGVEFEVPGHPSVWSPLTHNSLGLNRRMVCVHRSCTLSQPLWSNMQFFEWPPKPGEKLRTTIYTPTNRRNMTGTNVRTLLCWRYKLQHLTKEIVPTA